MEERRERMAWKWKASVRPFLEEGRRINEKLAAK
jgi:hypothetical protein